jgi:beta-N-acetylhexosaminidase
MRFKNKKAQFICSAFFLLNFGCTNANDTGDTTLKQRIHETTPENRFVKRNPNYRTLSDFFKFDKYKKEVDSIFNKLSIDEKAAQLIMPAASTNNYGLSFEEIKKLYVEKKIGCILFLKGNSISFRQLNTELKKLSEKNHLLEPIISADAEPTLLHNKFTDLKKITPAIEQKSISQVSSNCKIIVETLNNIGIKINFAPVVDISSNKSIINNRSWGNSDDTIIAHSKEFIDYHQKREIVTVLKHFPGHGNVKGDSHKKLVFIDGNLKELNNFKNLIKENVIGTMVGHIAIQNNSKWNTNGLPSTLSRNIVTTLLKDSLHFKGVVFTDAMNMGAVKDIPDASYKALCAGADVIVAPLNIEKLHNKIKQELDTNGEYKKQFEESIKKIIRLKYVLKIIK